MQIDTDRPRKRISIAFFFTFFHVESCKVLSLNAHNRECWEACLVKGGGQRGHSTNESLTV